MLRRPGRAGGRELQAWAFSVCTSSLAWLIDTKLDLPDAAQPVFQSIRDLVRHMPGDMPLGSKSDIERKIGDARELLGCWERVRAASAAASSIAGLMAARPLGEYVQRHFTTLPDLKGVRVTDISRRKFFGLTTVEVRTVQE